MKQHLLFSIATIGIFLLFITSNTFAFFSDEEQSVDNTLVCGTIDLSAPYDVEMSPGDLKPCQTQYITLRVQNTGLNEMDVWKSIKDIETFEHGLGEPEQAYYDQESIYYNPVDPDEPGSGKNDIDTVILYDLWIDVDGDTSFCDTGSGDVWVVQESQGLFLSDIEDVPLYLGRLCPGEEFVVVQSYHMAGGTGNWAQSDQIRFDIEFYAQQLLCGVGSPLESKVLVLPGDTVTACFDHPGSASYWGITLSGVPEGLFDVWDGMWTGWCVDQSHFISNHATKPVRLYSSYGPFIPERLRDPDWPKVNWIINHKPVGMPWQKVQDAIWEFIDGGYHGSDAETLALIAAANTYGTFFVPLQQQVMAVICWIDAQHQATFIEVDP